MRYRCHCYRARLQSIPPTELCFANVEISIAAKLLVWWTFHALLIYSFASCRLANLEASHEQDTVAKFWKRFAFVVEIVNSLLTTLGGPIGMIIFGELDNWWLVVKGVAMRLGVKMRKKQQWILWNLQIDSWDTITVRTQQSYQSDPDV